MLNFDKNTFIEIKHIFLGGEVFRLFATIPVISRARGCFLMLF